MKQNIEKYIDKGGIHKNDKEEEEAIDSRRDTEKRGKRKRRRGRIKQQT